MKRILLACFLLTATCSVTFVQKATAQTTPVTQASFTEKVNQMDAYIAAGNMTSAQATWEQVHQMMITVLGVTKASIRDAATPAVKASYVTIMQNQRTIYNAIWELKPDLAGNRTALHTKLGEFDATIY